MCVYIYVYTHRDIYKERYPFTCLFTEKQRVGETQTIFPQGGKLLN